MRKTFLSLILLCGFSQVGFGSNGEKRKIGGAEEGGGAAGERRGGEATAGARERGGGDQGGSSRGRCGCGFERGWDGGAIAAHWNCR